VVRPILRLSTLGEIDLRRGDGSSVQSVLVQPKRLALLVYLVVAGAGGRFVRRDTLLAMFWGDHPQRRARASLSTGLHFLRRSLGEGLIVARGNEELAVSAERIACDAVLFAEALDHGRPAEALAQYRGDFLPGFFVADAPGFEEWAANERERLQTRGFQAALELSHASRGLGAWEEACKWARRSLELRPYDEGALQLLLESQVASGTTAGALLDFERFSARLRRELDLEPSPEMVGWMETVRSAEVSRVPDPSGGKTPAPASDRLAPDLPAGGAPAAGAPEPAGEAEAGPRAASASSRRGLGFAAAGGALLLLGMLGAAGMMLFSGGPAETPFPGQIEVTPFENRTGDPSLEPVGYLAADWIAQGLVGTGFGDVVEPRPPGLTPDQPESARKSRMASGGRPASALRAGARTQVLGSYYLEGDEIVFHPRIIELATGTAVGPLGPVRGAPGELGPAVQTVRERVVAAMAALRDRRLEGWGHMFGLPPSLEAYLAYSAGLEHFQAGRAGEALPHLERAAQIDTTFLAPVVWAAQAHLQLGDHESAAGVAWYLGARRERLSPAERYRLDCYLARLAGDQGAAYEAIKRAGELNPEQDLHNYAFASAWQNRPLEAIDALLALYPQGEEERRWRSWRYWGLLTFQYHILGDHEAELRHVREARRRAPDLPELLGLEVRALVALGREAEALGALEPGVALLASGRGADPAAAAQLLYSAAAEFQAHGFHQTARRLFCESAELMARPPEADRAAPSRRARYVAALYHSGQVREALQEAAGALAGPEDGTGPQRANARHELRTFQGMAHARLGDRERATQVLEDLLEAAAGATWPAERHQLLRGASSIAAVLGEPDRAVDLIVQAFSSLSLRGYATELHAVPELETLRDHPRFAHLLAIDLTNPMEGLAPWPTGQERARRFP
jgi:DNA-binding SARP family transcriptional activator